MDTATLETLEVLVDELLKDVPKEEVIKEHMERAGLTYENDPVLRLNNVLQALHFTEPQLKFKDEK